MTPDAVRLKIIAAWHNLPPLPASAIGHDGDGLHLERDAVVAFFAEKNWQEISWAELLRYEGDPSACLSFMSPRAYRYFLASYMLVSLDHYRESDVSADTACRSLSPPADPAFHRYWADRVSGFSAAQKVAIHAFLEFMVAEHGSDYGYGVEDLWNAVAYWKPALNP